MTLNLQQRFLYLFADYREAIEAQQRLGDEVIALRARLEETQAELLEVRKDSIERERELNDRLMRLRFGDRLTAPAESLTSLERPPTTAQPDNPLQWKQQMNAKFQEDLQKYASRLNGSGQDSTH